MSRRRSGFGMLLAALLAALSVGCAGPTQLARAGGVGGTGLAGGDDDGIGGTGLGGDDGGIGGTGIYGTVTALGSIWVNGLHIVYAEDVPVTVNGAPASAADLARGRVVWVQATAGPDGIRAESIEIWSAVVGRVTAIDVDARTFVAAGQTVEVPPGTRVLGTRSGVAGLSVGDRLDVAGLRRPDGRVVASRIDRAGSSAPERRSGPRVDELVRRTAVARLSIEGYASEVGAEASFRIEGMQVDVSGLAVARIARNAQVWVSGTRTGPETLRAERIQAPELSSPIPPPPGPDAGGRLPDLLPAPDPPEPTPPPVRPEPDPIDRLDTFEPVLEPTRVLSPESGPRR